MENGGKNNRVASSENICVICILLITGILAVGDLLQTLNNSLLSQNATSLGCLRGLLSYLYHGLAIYKTIETKI